MSGVTIRTRDVLPIFKVDLSRLDSTLRHGVQQCLDEANSLIRVNNAAQALRAARAAETSDELLEPMTSGQTITRGRFWNGEGENEKLDAKVAPIYAFTGGFVPPNILHSQSPGVVIDLGRTYLPQVKDEGLRESLRRSMDEAEQEWEKDPRYGRVKGTRPEDLVARTFTPGTQRSEAERYRQPGDGPLSSCMYPPGAQDQSRTPCDIPAHERGTQDARPMGSSLFAHAAQHTRDGTAARVAGRVVLNGMEVAKAKPPPIANSRTASADYAAALAAGRKAKAFT